MTLPVPTVDLPTDPAWGPDQVTLRCRSTTDLSAEVRELTFEVASGRLDAHRAGQHLVIGVEVDGRRVRRSYTISSPPTRPHRVSITVKRETVGTVSRWLHDSLAVGDTLVAQSRPQGEFTMDDAPDERYLLLAGGVGVTPFLAMLRARHDLREGAQAVLLHHVRDLDLLVARPELEFYDTTEPWFDYRPVPEAPPAGWTGPDGRVSATQLATAVPDVLARTVLVCGPPAYVDAVYDVLDTLGVPDDRRRTERFSSTEPAPAMAVDPAEPLAGERGPFRVRFARSGREIECAGTQTLLAAVLEAGLPAAFSCGEGVCGTCKSTLLEGRVDMRHQGGIRPREIASGAILLCCSTPEEDVVIDA